MASPKKRASENADGEFFVDTGCIDCGTCQWMVPEVFGGVKDQSFVRTQPGEAPLVRRALEAIIACPTGSIGTMTKHDLRPAMEAFPLPVVKFGDGDAGIYDLGFHSRDSFGATSYLIVREGRENVMLDSPRFNKGLAERVKALGGVQRIFLTHRDDVADHERYAEAFGAPRYLHRTDKRHSTRNVENLLEITEPTSLPGPDGPDDEFLMIPTPGHTEGSMCLLYTPAGDEGGPYLFSGDHLAWDILRKRLFSFRGACWYDWDEQIRSTELLRDHDFAWVLPGHGPRGGATVETMREALEGCIAWMRR